MIYFDLFAKTADNPNTDTHLNSCHATNNSIDLESIYHTEKSASVKISMHSFDFVTKEKNIKSKFNANANLTV